MSDGRLKVGIAGYGIVGKRRRRYIDQHPRLKTMAVSDQTFSGRGILDDGVFYFDKYQDIYSAELDALFVCLPNYLAADATIRGLECGLHVFCEKPPGRDVADIVSVRNVERKHPELKLRYGFNHRYHPSVKEARGTILSGKLGTIINMIGVYGKSHIIPYEKGWRSERKMAGGGILLDQGIHMVDLMMLFCGDFPFVTSVVSNSYWNHDVEDNAYALMKSERGQVAIIHSSATKWQHKFSLDITLTEGYLRLAGILSGSKSYGEETLTIGKRIETDTGTPREEIIKYLNDLSWGEEIADFADSIIQNRPVVDGTSLQALKTMELVYRIYQADLQWCRKFALGKKVAVQPGELVKNQRNSAL